MSKKSWLICAIGFTTAPWAIAFSQHPSFAQITPDNTLGAEGSVVTPLDPLSDRIDGGATRDANLFHSFQDFNIGEGRGAYFANPVGIENIFSRVTGGNPSNILGTLGVLGEANLFLLNPNGIIFGENASLDLQGSFLGTTASGFVFGENGVFSAVNPEVPAQILTVNPSAFLFNQLPAGSIINNSVAPAGTSPEGRELSGLKVPDGQSLLLVGGDIEMDRGSLNAPGGRIELGGLAEVGTVALERTGNSFILGFPSQTQLSNITLANDSRVSVRGNGGGDIVVNTNLLNATNGGRLVAGTEGAGNGGDITVNATQINLEGVGLSDAGSGFYNQKIGDETVISNAGNITINTESLNASSDAALSTNVLSGVGNGGDIIINTGSLSLASGTLLSTSTFGQGNAGNVSITAGETVSLDDANIFSTVEAEAVGSGGNITISTGSLSLLNGAQLIAATLGEGNAGSVLITARDAVFLDGVNSDGFFSGIFSRVDSDAVGNGGDITIETGLLSLTSGTLLSTSTFGQGNAGNVSINAGETVAFDNADIFSTVEAGAVGSGGNITINTGSLSLLNGAQLIANTLGEGNAGSIFVTARDAVFLDGVNDDGLFSGIFSRVGSDAVGNGGDITIETGSLSLASETQLSTSTFGQGNGGDITINAGDTISLDNSLISSSVLSGSVGNGGNITIETGTLSVSNGLGLTNSTSGQGNAGNIIINARDSVSFTRNGNADSSTLSEAVGNGGDITITTGSLFFTDGGSLTTSTRGQGDSGNVRIEVRDTVSFQGEFSGISTTVDSEAVGNGGDIAITTESLSFADRSGLFASTFGQGNGGSITINTRDTISIDNSLISMIVTPGAVGNGGNLTIETGSLSVSNGGGLGIFTSGQGDAGNTIINARDTVSFTNNGSALSNVTSEGVGNAGDIAITTGSLFVTDGSQLTTSTSGQGDAGNIFVKADESIELTNNSSIRTAVEPGAVGNGGNIDIETRSLLATGGSQVLANVFREYGNLPGGQGKGGNIRVNASDSINLSGINAGGFSSGLLTLTERGANGQAGDILVNTGSFRIADGAAVTAQTFNPSDGGNITINTNTLEALNGGQVLVSTSNQGMAGNITINAQDSIILSGSDPNFAYRLAQFGDDAVISEGAASGVFANTRSNSTGNGGTITLQTNTLSLSERAQISANSQGTGNAGSVDITVAENLTLNNSDITTASAQSAGGVININAGDIRLSGDSDITTSVFSGAGGGGNLTITADSVIAFDDSDILAFARDGKGGDINFNTSAFFGQNFQPAPKNTDPVTLDNNNRVDVNASGAISGEINTPDVSSIENSLTQQRESLIDAEELLANSCIVRSQLEQPESTFFIVGKGGLPERPGDLQTSVFTLGTIRNLPTDSPVKKSNEWQEGDPIIEPQGVYRLPNGELVLSRECHQ